MKEINSTELPLVELSLKHVTYAPVTSQSSGKKFSAEKKRKTVLSDITTTVSPFKLSAWMGPSGAGKSSLLSVCADLIDSGDLMDGSQITVNGEKGRIPKRLVGVVWQDDLLLSNLTVRENIFYSARLKTPEYVSDSDVNATVDQVMKELSIFHVRDSLVGSPASGMRGISGGERKRVAIGETLILQPSVLLLDEPTSGLDATTALSLISTLRSLADKGHSIAVVIHQPRTTIYNMFDHLLLLSKGRMIYDGSPSQARRYLESCPSVPELPLETGIADWLMDVIIGDEKSDGKLPDLWAEFENKASVHEGSKKRSTERTMSTLEDLNKVRKYNTSFFTQLKLLTRRTMKQQRGERLTATAVMLQVAYLFFTALFWWQLSDDTGRIFERNSLLFFMIIAQANGIVISAVTVFQRERVLLSRERAKKMYRVSSYFIGKTVSDMTNNVIMPLLYGMIVYWTAGFRGTVVAYLKFILAFYLTLSTAQSMGLWMSIIIPRVQIALVLAPPITLFFMIMGGFYIPFENMHPGVAWASWLSFARYGYSALIINEYSGRSIPCADPDDISLTIGTIDECPLPGEAVVESLGITGIADEYWFNIGMIVLLQVSFRFAAYAFLLKSKK